MPQRVKFSNKNQWPAIFKTKILLSFSVKQIYCLYIAYSVFIESKSTYCYYEMSWGNSLLILKRINLSGHLYFYLFNHGMWLVRDHFKQICIWKLFPISSLCLICLFVWTSTFTYNLDWDFVWNNSGSRYYFFQLHVYFAKNDLRHS